MSALLIGEAEAKFPFRHSTGVDCKAWAKRINYRFERGDKDLLPVQITFAQMALGIKPEVTP
jgi:hypothetical protein